MHPLEQLRPPKDGSLMFLRNVGTYTQPDTVSRKGDGCLIKNAVKTRKIQSQQLLRGAGNLNL